jgi:hypothetical protein
VALRAADYPPLERSKQAGLMGVNLSDMRQLSFLSDEFVGRRSTVNRTSCRSPIKAEISSELWFASDGHAGILVSYDQPPSRYSPPRRVGALRRTRHVDPTASVSNLLAAMSNLSAT